MFENTYGRVTFYVKLQVIDLHLYLKYYSSIGVFQTFWQQKPTTWFLHKSHIGRKWVYVIKDVKSIGKFLITTNIYILNIICC